MNGSKKVKNGVMTVNRRPATFIDGERRMSKPTNIELIQLLLILHQAIKIDDLRRLLGRDVTVIDGQETKFLVRLPPWIEPKEIALQLGPKLKKVEEVKI